MQNTELTFIITLAVLVLVIIIILRACINWSPKKEQHKVSEIREVIKKLGYPNQIADWDNRRGSIYKMDSIFIYFNKNSIHTLEN